MTPSTLEVLYVARARLTRGRAEFEFVNWTTCTCGHIYAAYKGRKASSERVVAATRDQQFADVIQAVARALGWDGDVVYNAWGPENRAAWAAAYVSNYSRDAATSRFEMHRDDALVVVNKAIATIEARQERDRLDVLAQVRAIVDAVPVEVAA